MADSSSEEEFNAEQQHVFYKDRPDWKDVEPIAQDDGPHPIVKIAYSDVFTDVYDYFRAIIKRDERSERALALTADAIKLNPANYTVWHYRRVILKDLGQQLGPELGYITNIIKKHPKNYQVWYHRQMIVQSMNDPAQELSFTASILAKDAKNYHAWQHRQWVIKTFSLWENELAYIDELLAEDVRNNSAWNQRYFVVSNTTGYTEEALKYEIKYSIDAIKKARNNESPWNYMRGIVGLNSYSKNPEVNEFCEELYTSQQCRSPHLLSLMVDICEEALENKENMSQQLNKALNLCAELATQYDTIRASYWTFIAAQMEKKYQPVPESS